MILEARDIILRPVVSEKSYGHAAKGKYTFEVVRKATKPDIRRAVEEIWGVRVVDVNTIKRRGKPIRGKNFAWSQRSDKRFAIVTLAQGEKIELFEGA